MQFTVRGITVLVDNFTDEDYQAICEKLKDALSRPPTTVSNRQAIKWAFEEGLRRAPNVNPSDLWHHVVYRQYRTLLQDYREVDDPTQSWVRASGDAFELFLQDYYNGLLEKTGVRLVALINRADKPRSLQMMGIGGEVGDSKLDIAIMGGCDPAWPASLDNGEIVGGLHLKASLAERVSDDEPCSRAMMRKGYTSYLITLDVKSFPTSATLSDARAYRNNGELGTPDRPSAKRKYIEEQACFDGCFSFNLRTVPTPAAQATKSGKRIYTCRLDGQWDALCDALIEAMQKTKK